MPLTKKEQYQLAKEMLHVKFDGRCALCGDPLGKVWNIWHINPKDSVITPDGELLIGDDSYENKLPACKPCNGTRVHYNLTSFESYRKHLMQSFYFLTDNPYYKKAVRYGLISPTNTNIQFYFETVKP